jgi:hypothetical protein
MSFMRLHFLMIFALITSCLLGQQSDSALLVLSVNSYDFGRISIDNGIVSHSFVFRNSGNKSLKINNVRTTCGCTVPSWTTEDVKPGDEGYIKVDFDPAGSTGPFHKTIQILSNASNTNMFLTISGIILPALKKEELKFNIGELSTKTNYLNFGYLYKGSTGIELLTVANLSSKTMNINFMDMPPHIRALAIPDILEPGQYGQIEVQYCTEKTDDWDMKTDKIDIIINGKNDKNC